MYSTARFLKVMAAAVRYSVAASSERNSLNYTVAVVSPDWFVSATIESGP